MVYKKILEELSWIPEYLSNSVFNLYKISFEKKDLKQELYLTLIISIKKYIKLKIKQRGNIDYTIGQYCHTACKNKQRDILRKVLRKNIKNDTDDIDKYSVGIEVEKYIEFLEISDENFKILICGFDILSVEDVIIKKMIFRDFILGVKIRELSVLYDKPISSISGIINQVKNKIYGRYHEIIRESQTVEKEFIIKLIDDF